MARAAKALVGAVASGVLAISLAACASTEQVSAPREQVAMSADWPAYDTLAEATSTADLVVEGEYLSSAAELMYPEVSVDTGDERTNPQFGLDPDDIDLDALALVTTVSEIRVTEVLKGDVAVGDIIRVSQPGGMFDGVFSEVASVTLLVDVEAPRVMLLLSDGGAGEYHIINPEQGLYAVRGEQIDPVAPRGGYGDLDTVDDLRQAIASNL